MSVVALVNTTNSADCNGHVQLNTSKQGSPHLYEGQEFSVWILYGDINSTARPVAAPPKSAKRSTFCHKVC